MARRLRESGEHRSSVVWAYYAVLHAVHAKAARENVHPVSHPDARNYLTRRDPTSVIARRLKALMGELYNISEKARYLRGSETHQGWAKGVSYSGPEQIADHAIELMDIILNGIDEALP